ncbi:MAG: hypothetical protein PHG23_02465, partial [Candidatus Pacebacteria bacterium]|nr:hypothetical protein [Candidatus Paceibacterota bacterium]
ENKPDAAASLAKKKERAIQEIDRRIASLNTQIERINSAKRLTAGQKSSLVSQVQNEIKSLTQLKAKINADTDLATLLADKQSIIGQYRIFALFQPQIAIISYADKIIQIADLMDAKTTDTAIKAQIADAKSKAQKAISDVTVLKPEGYPANKEVLRASKNLLTAARQELNEARVAMKKAATPAGGNTPATAN